jgi:hypothetical protein
VGGDSIEHFQLPDCDMHQRDWNNIEILIPVIIII